MRRLRRYPFFASSALRRCLADLFAAFKAVAYLPAGLLDCQKLLAFDLRQFVFNLACLPFEQVIKLSIKVVKREGFGIASLLVCHPSDASFCDLPCWLECPGGSLFCLCCCAHDCLSVEV